MSLAIITAHFFPNLSTFQNWSQATLRQICGLNAGLKMTEYIIVIRKKDESLIQTLEECTPGWKAHTMYVAWSKMSAKGNSLFAIVV